MKFETKEKNELLILMPFCQFSCIFIDPLSSERVSQNDFIQLLKEKHWRFSMLKSLMTLKCAQFIFQTWIIALCSMRH